MRKIFDVELSAGNGLFTELSLPATPYALLDAREKLRLEEGREPNWDIVRCFEGQKFVDHLDTKGSLSELNTLCEQLAQLDERQTAIVEGLVRMEYEGGTRPIPMSRFIDMAYSTDRCHFLDGVVDNARLGRFCAENGFVPEADDLSDEAFELLDFAKIGRDFRRDVGGVFTPQGYVQRHDELREMHKILNYRPQTPDYTVLAVTSSGCEVKLPFPANEPMATEVVRCADCAAPALIGITGGMESMDLLARRLQSMEKFGELPKYKAVLETAELHSLDTALTLADELDQYTFSPNLRTPEDVALEKLHVMLDADEVEFMWPHLNLHAYGQALVERFGGMLTEYGSVERADGEPIQVMEQEHSTSEMEMML